MTVLLDTHTLVWSLVEPSRLSNRVAELIADERNTVLISAASVWEIATKVRASRFSEAEAIERDFENIVNEAGYTLIAIDAAIALRAGRLPGEHRDPFDRTLAAHAQALDIPILSIDPKLDTFGVRRIW
jgi:PIN domain nuclease of toxin-antitoxin system